MSDIPQTRSYSASSHPGRSTYVWAAILVVGTALTLLGQFAMDGLADQNQTWHWAQHAAMFWGGVMAGASVLRLYQIGNRSA